MKILAIETSCDDTAVAVLEEINGSFTVKSNIVSSQMIHQNYGGVFPMMAKREHQKNMVPVFKEALEKAGLLIKKSQEKLPEEVVAQISDILKKEPELLPLVLELLENYQKPVVDFLAVTNGPGLEPCLWVGVNFARVISLVWNLSLIPVNHIEAHILVNILTTPKLQFPAIALVVSGGHTQLVLVRAIGDYQIIGETRDDAAGECFDKCARVLGLGYPGGPIISKIAGQKTQSNISLPRPMMHSGDYDFSFSGLKTAVLYKTQDSTVDENFVENMAFEIQESIIEVLLKKTLKATQDVGAKMIILGGGVSANQALRDAFLKNAPVPVVIPPQNLSTDNAVMIGVTAYFHQDKKIAQENMSVSSNLRLGQ